ncbi:MAG: right-handed parallel beta-helix repeat-containing protein, partial [Bacteroidales bacterium]
MKSTILFTVITIICLISTSCHQKGKTAVNTDGRILKVPSEFATIAEAVKNSNDGDWIILAPGKYMEMKIDLDKSVTISSEWKLAGDELKIEETIIDSQDSILFNIKKDGVEISGLRIINGDHPLNIMARATIKNNHFVDNLDAMSYEGSGGGYTGYNTVENDRDDGLDLDIRYGGDNRGSDIIVEHNTIMNSNDDGIEIRLYDYPDQNIHYTIRGNRISGSKNAGIQVISYDIFTGKT